MSDDYYDDMIRQRGGDTAAKIFADDCRKLTEERDNLRNEIEEWKWKCDQLEKHNSRLRTQLADGVDVWTVEYQYNTDEIDSAWTTQALAEARRQELGYGYHVKCITVMGRKPKEGGAK